MASPYRRASALLDQLSRRDLERLRDQIAKRLEALAAQAAKPPTEAEHTSGSGAPAKAPGWIEEKYITVAGREYGPYHYRRWWDGRVLRSQYLGKAQPAAHQPKRGRAGRAHAP